MLNSKSIGDKIAKARKKLNLSQADLAKQVSISPQAVGKWERGESLPDISTLNRIAEILGVDLNYFSDNFPTSATNLSLIEKSDKSTEEEVSTPRQQKTWDMSKLNLSDSNFSGLNNLHEKLANANIQRCQFVGSELSQLHLTNNFVQECIFSSADMRKSNIQHSMFNQNKFIGTNLSDTKFAKSYFENCDFTGADFSGSEFISGGFGKNILINAKLKNTVFTEMAIQDIVFEGTIEDSHFENCSFYSVKFQNATLHRTFFKNNKRFKRVQFINCKADKLTYAFLKNNLADLSGISIIPD